MTIRLLSISLLLSLGLGLCGCPKKKGVQPPAGFLPGAEVVTEDAALNERIAKARELATMDGEGIGDLRRLAEEGDERAVSDLVQLLVGRGDTLGALAVMGEWVADTGYSERAMASYLDLALGAEHTEQCLTATLDYLRRYPNHPYLHIARGICLSRFNNTGGAMYSFTEGLNRIGNLKGFTGTLERALGLSRMDELPAEAVFHERVELMEFLAPDDLVGYVAVRHISQIDEETAPIDPRLLPPGGVTTEQLRGVFLGRRDAFRHCQKLFSTPRWIPGGRLVIHVVVRGDGSPGAITRQRNTFEVDGVPQCLEEQVRNLWFPQPRYGKGLMYEREFRMTGN